LKAQKKACADCVQAFLLQFAVIASPPARKPCAAMMPGNGMMLRRGRHLLSLCNAYRLNYCLPETSPAAVEAEVNLAHRGLIFLFQGNPGHPLCRWLLTSLSKARIQSFSAELLPATPLSNKTSMMTPDFYANFPLVFPPGISIFMNTVQRGRPFL